MSCSQPAGARPVNQRHRVASLARASVYADVVEKGEFEEEVVVAREKLVTKLKVEEADRRVEFLGGGYE